MSAPGPLLLGGKHLPVLELCPSLPARCSWRRSTAHAMRSTATFSLFGGSWRWPSRRLGLSRPRSGSCPRPCRPRRGPLTPRLGPLPHPSPPPFVCSASLLLSLCLCLLLNLRPCPPPPFPNQRALPAEGPPGAKLAAGDPVQPPAVSSPVTQMKLSL